VVSAADAYGRNLAFLDRIGYFCTHEADRTPVPDPLLLRKSGSAGNHRALIRMCIIVWSPLDKS
jgi:hypothetical protein